MPESSNSRDRDDKKQQQQAAPDSEASPLRRLLESLARGPDPLVSDWACRMLEANPAPPLTQVPPTT